MTAPANPRSEETPQSHDLQNSSPDLSIPPVFLKDFWRARTSAEVVIASRYVSGGQADMAISRRVLSTILNRSYAILLGLKLRDLSSGFRMYDRKVINNIDLRARDF